MLKSFAAKDGTLLDNDQLHHITRNIKASIPSTEDELALDQLHEILENVLHTASDATQNGHIRVAAWNALCALIDKLAVSDLPLLRDSLWVAGLWLEAHGLYIEQAPFSKPKPSRQLLSTLTNALEKGKGSRESKQSALDTAVYRQIELLVIATDSSVVKTCAALTSHFLLRGVVSIGQLESSFEDVSKSSPRRRDWSSLQDFLFLLFQWMHKGDFGITISNLISNILDRLAQQSEPSKSSDNLPIWVLPLEQAFSSDGGEIDDLRAHLLPVLFKRSLEDYATLLSRMTSKHALMKSSTASGSSQHDMLYASLQTGKDLGLLSLTNDTEMSFRSNSVSIPFKLVAALMQDYSYSARLTGLSILVKSTSATKPFDEKSLECVRENLNQLLADTDANFRGEVVSLVQRLVDRLRAITAVLDRSITKDDKSTASEDSGENRMSLDYHKQFLDWLINTLVWELRPTASYQRHISALKCLSIIIRSGVCDGVDIRYFSKSAQGQVKWPYKRDVISKEIRRSLLDLLVDPFDDVRLLAANILEMAPLGQDGDSYPSLLREVIQRAERNMLDTGRASQADGVAYLYNLLNQTYQAKTVSDDRCYEGSSVHLSLLCQLEDMLKIAKGDITEAVQHYPIHGTLTALRLVLSGEAPTVSSDHTLIARISLDLHDLWNIVKPILCNDAPEGFIPEEMEEVTVSSTRDTLNFCWRALKEASLLLGLIVSWTDAAKPTQDSVYSEVVLPLSELCFQQLAELRHRGAFSTVAQTWVECCIKTGYASMNGKPALDIWFERVLLILRNNTTINTRRSAGLPSLVCGILVGAKDEAFFELAFTSLDRIARMPVDPKEAQEGSLSQVHAMNCLKDILKNTRLGETSERFVPAALKLAADALRSEAWAVRNCGLMLFRGVIDRLLGTTESFLDGKASNQKIITEEQCPGLLDVVLNLMSADTNALSARHEGVFPGLQLLQRLKVPEDKRAKTLDAVLALTGSSVWHVRDKAARTFTSFVTREEAFSTLEWLLSRSSCSQNVLHGALLCARYVVAKTLSTGLNEEICEYQRTFSRLLLSMRNALYHSNTCLVTRGAYVDVLNELQASSSAIVSATDIEDFDFIAELEILLQTADDSNLKAIPMLALARGAALSFWKMDVGRLARLTKLLLDLATSDVDACAEVFNIINSSSSSADLHNEQANLLTSIGISLLSAEQISTTLKASVQEAMLHVLNVTSTNLERLPELLQQLRLTRTEVQKKGKQSDCDVALQVRALAFERSHLALESSASVDVIEFQCLVQDCMSGMSEQGYYTREAVSLALQHLHQTWRLDFDASRPEKSLISICIVLYDLLNDDDEDIRLRASETCARLLTSHSSQEICAQPVPLVISSRLLDWMSSRWSSSSSEFAAIVLSRAFNPHAYSSPNMDSSAHLPLPRVEHLLTKFLDISTVLFIEEKQNLYIDPSREIHVWSLIANDLSLAAIPPSIPTTINAWTIDALTTLKERALQHIDGPLGWSTNADVFVLGLQVIYAAAWLIRVGEKPESKEIDAVAIRKLLDEFGSAVTKAEVNFFWQHETAEVGR